MEEQEPIFWLDGWMDRVHRKRVKKAGANFHGHESKICPTYPANAKLSRCPPARAHPPSHPAQHVRPLCCADAKPLCVFPEGGMAFACLHKKRAVLCDSRGDAALHRLAADSFAGARRGNPFPSCEELGGVDG